MWMRMCPSKEGGPTEQVIKVKPDQAVFRGHNANIKNGYYVPGFGPTPSKGVKSLLDSWHPLLKEPKTKLTLPGNISKGVGLNSQQKPRADLTPRLKTSI